VLTLRGWIGGLGGAAAVTIGVVIAALIAAGLTAFHGGGSHLNIPATPHTLALGDQGKVGTAAVSSSSAQHRTQKPFVRRSTSHRRTSALTGHSGPVRERRGGAQAPAGRAPSAPGGGSHDSTSPTTGTPSTSTPSPGSGGGNPGGGGGGGGTTIQPPSSLGGAVKNTTNQLGDTVNNTTQALGNTVGAVSPVLGDTVKQTGPALGDTVKGTGDLVGNTVDGLLGGHH
jgi:hypothetical protein